MPDVIMIIFLCAGDRELVSDAAGAGGFPACEFPDAMRER